MKKILGIVAVFAVLMLTTLTSCDSPYDDCYKENKKAMQKKAIPKQKLLELQKLCVVNEKTFRDLGSGFVEKTKDMSKNGC